ncbi:MAG TPA: SMP-30/gluconolactonase/LRE family protein [Chryseolinea sp.]
MPHPVVIRSSSCIFFLATFLCFAAQAQFYHSSIGYSKPNPLLRPEYVAVDASGNIYVTDNGNDRVQKFNSSGEFITMWGTTGSGNGEFNNPTGIAVDGNGDVYVCDTSPDRIQKFTSSGTFITTWGSFGTGNGQFDDPDGIAVDGNGNVFVTDKNNKRIQKFSSTGIFITQWALGHDNLPFVDLRGIASDAAGNIYVVDAYTTKIQKFNNSGTFLSVFGGYGSGDGKFDTPVGIAIDENQNIFISDGGNTFNNHRIQKFNSAGGFISKWGQKGTGSGDFNDPMGVALDANGNVYVCEWANDRIQKFDNNGTFILKWGSIAAGDMDYFYRPAGVTTDGSGNIYVADTENHRIQKFNSAGNFIMRFGEEGSADGQFLSPESVAIAPDGSIYVTDTNNDRIQKFNSDGVFALKWGTSGTGLGQLKKPSGIALDKDGNVYVSDTDNSRIQKFSSTGQFIVSWGTNGTGDGQLRFPGGIAFNEEGDLYVADTNNGRIQKFSNSGMFMGSFGTEGSADGELYYPLAVALDVAGNIYVADQLNDRIQKFSPEGEFITKWGTEGSGDGDFDNPSGIAIDTDGHVFVADPGNHRIQKFGVLTIESLSVPKAAPGASVTITGTGFSSTPEQNSVSFNNVAAPTITAASPSALTVTVPNGATTGVITVIREGFKAESVSEFIVEPFEITSVNPSIDKVGAPVVITGSGFSDVESSNLVKFGNITAEVTQSSFTSITVTVPAGAVSGDITVTISGQTITAPNTFTVTKLSITQVNYPEFFDVDAAGLSVSMTVNDSKEIQSVKFVSKGITADESTLKSMDVTFSASSNQISFTVPAATFTDPLGLYSWFSVLDKQGEEVRSLPAYTYLEYGASSSKQVIPDLSFGKKVSNYQIVTVPLDLDNSTVPQVFNALGGNDDKKWRLFSLISESIKEYPAFSSIETGRGYWLIAANQTEINPGKGHTLQVTPDAPFEIALEAGWNLIGNPYNFTISSADIEEANGLPGGTLDFKQYLNGTFKNEEMLKPYRGAFVHTDVAQNIKIPTINHSPTGGRKQEVRPSTIDSKAWEVDLALNDGDLRNELFGFGMNPKGSEQKDLWDEVALPMLEGLNFFDMTFREIDGISLTKDIVPTQDNYSWQARISSEHGLTMTWDNEYFGDNDKQLFMEIESMVDIVDMRRSIKSVVPPGEQVIKIHYGDDAYVKHQLMESNTRVGSVFPNPSPRNTNLLSVFVSLPEGINRVGFELSDVLGRRAGLSGAGIYNGGRKAIELQEDFSQLSPGVYLLRLEIKDANGVTSLLNKKVIFE